MSKHDAEDMEAAATYKEHTPTLAEQIGHAYDKQRRVDQLSKAANDATRAYQSASDEKFRAEEVLWKMLCEQIPIDTSREQWGIDEMRGLIMAAITLAVVK